MEIPNIILLVYYINKIYKVSGILKIYGNFGSLKYLLGSLKKLKKINLK